MSLETASSTPNQMTSMGIDTEARLFTGSASKSGETTPKDLAPSNDHDEIVSLPASVEPEYATGLRLFLIMFTIFMSTLLTTLEIGIIATAIPGITNVFHRLDDVGWYGSATFLVGGASSSMWGKLYKYTNVNYTYLVAVALFLMGSIVAAAAPNSEAVIVGRAFQGFGILGTLSGSLLVIDYVSQPEKRPVLIGSWMAVFMISTNLGRLAGGAFTSGPGWRWCFWINLPLGVPIVILILLFLEIPAHIKLAQATWQEIILQLDLPKFSLLLASLACLTLTLQWGGQPKA